MAERNLSRFTWAAFKLQESASLKLRQLRCSQCHVLPRVRGLILNNIKAYHNYATPLRNDDFTCLFQGFTEDPDKLEF